MNKWIILDLNDYNQTIVILLLKQIPTIMCNKESKDNKMYFKYTLKNNDLMWTCEYWM